MPRESDFSITGAASLPNGSEWLELDDSYFHQPDDEIKVCLNVVVLNLADISTANQSYSMHLELWVAWPLSKDEVIRYYDDRKKWAPKIHPEPTPWTIEITEIKKMTFVSGHTTQVFIWQNKVVACECTLVTARFLETLELVNFPFDCQHLNFMVGIRCDCDLPLKVDTTTRTVHIRAVDSPNIFKNIDGRTMTTVKLNEEACSFNVKGELLSLQDFELWGIECEIENKNHDIPILYCSIRMSRNYQPYVTRIFLPLFIIMFNSSLVFRFSEGILDSKLNYVITNMLTIVAFLFIVQFSLPNIPYLTLVDKYTNFAFIYILAISGFCVGLNYMDLENGFTESIIFLCTIATLLSSHIIFIYICIKSRKVEYNKMQMDRHRVEELEKERLGIHYKKHKEFLVNTAHNQPQGKYNVYEGSIRELFDPPEAAGWLNEGRGHLRTAMDEIYPTQLHRFLSRMQSFNPLLESNTGNTTNTNNNNNNR